MAAEDGARGSQSPFYEKGKENSRALRAADSPKQQNTRNVQAKKSALDDLLHSDTDSHTENPDSEREEN